MKQRILAGLATPLRVLAMGSVLLGAAGLGYGAGTPEAARGRAVAATPGMPVESRGLAGDPGRSMRQDTVEWSELSRSMPAADPGAVASGGRVQRRNGRWVRTGVGVSVPSGAIEASAPEEGATAQLAGDVDPLFTLAGGAPPSPSPGLSFGAVLDDGSRFNPDSQGAAGPNHLMVALSSVVRIQDKQGNVQSSVTLEQFWSGLGATQVFDPRLVYDPSGQRWIHVAIANPGQTNAGLLVAVSQTSNPTGGWNRHFIGMGATNNIFADSPNVGFNRNWITIQANTFDNTNFNFFSSDIWAFGKTNLYAGGPANHRRFRYVTEGLGPVNAMVPAATYDETEGTNFMVANWLGTYVDPVAGAIGLLRLYSIGGPVDAPVFNDYGPNGLFVYGSAGIYNPAWADFDPLDGNFAPQLGTTNKIYVGDSRIKNVVVRNSTLWCAHHVFLPFGAPTRSSVQWFAMTPGGTVLQRGRVDDAAGTKFFAYPSIAVNQNEDVLLGYTRFGADQYPSANYAFHGYEDFPGTLRADTVLKAGEAPFAADDRGITPWGDWSATVVDPNDIDLWTLQQYAATPSGGDRWGTWWGVISPPTSLSIAMTGAPNPVLATSNVTYSIRITNNFGLAATGVRIVDTLPAGAVFVSATASAGSCSQSGGVVNCSIGTLAPNASATASIVARLVDSGTATNVASVVAFGPDENGIDNTAVTLTTVTPAADLRLQVTDSPDPVDVNATLTYQVAVTNAGPSAAPAVFLTNTIPAGVTFVSATAGQGSCSRSGSVVTCTLGTILASGSVPVTIRVTPNASASLTNTTVVAATSVDPIPANNTVVTITRANAAPTLTTIANRGIAEDGTTGPIAVTVGDAETPATALVLGGFSSASSIVPNANILFGGSGSNRTVTVTPAPNANGVVTISFYVVDGDAGAVTNSFVLTVNAVNDSPAITDIPNQSINEDAVLGPLAFTVGDVETPAGSLSVSATSSNPSLVPSSAVVLAGTGAARTLTITPSTNQFGTATISVFVSDGVSNSVDTFLLTVNSVNDIPTVSTVSNRTIDEDTGTGAIALTVGDVETPVANLQLSGTSSNPTLVPNANIVFGGSAASRTVTVTPAADQFGTANITVSVTDGNGGVTNRTFQLTVNNLNDPPTLGAISSIAVNEDSGTNAITLTVISAGPGNEVQTLSLVATSSIPSVIPHPTIEYTSPATTGTLRFAPVNNATGTVAITVIVDDGASTNNLAIRTFNLTVLPVNDAPTLSPVSNRTIEEDGTTGPIPLTVGDVDTAVASLTVSVTSTNSALVPPGSVILGGAGADRTLEVRPATNQFGTTLVSVVVSDGQASATNTFVLDVTPVNDPPSLAGLGAVTLGEDASTNVTFTVSDDETSAESLILSVGSSNPSLLPVSGLVLGGTGGARTLQITPVSNAAGAATVTVEVRDAGGLAATNSFVVTVLPVNDPPTLAALGNVSVAEDAAQQTVNLAGIGSGAPNEAQTLVVSASSSNPSVVPTPVVAYLSPNAAGTLTFTPVPNASGTAVISVTVDDGQAVNATVTRTFTVNVTPVNDRPTVTVPVEVVLAEDGMTNLTVQVGDVETPAGALVLQSGSSNEELIDASGIILSGAGAVRTLTLMPLTNQFGSSTITLQVSDADGGTETVFVNLTVLPINDRPSVSPLADIEIRQDTSTPARPFTVLDEETFADDLTVVARSSDSVLVPAGGLVLGGSGFDRTLQVTPAAGRYGVATISVDVTDSDGATNTSSFVLTVKVVNLPPTFAPIEDRVVAEDAPEQVVAIGGIFSGAAGDGQVVTLSAVSSNPSVVPDPVVVYASPAATGELRFRPVANASGTAIITVTANDGMPEDNLFSRTFTVTVTPVNDGPTIAAVPDQGTDKNRATGVIPLTVGDLEAPATALTVSAISSNTGLVASASIVLGGEGANRTMVIAPESNRVGYSMITVVVTDPEGATAATTFRLTVFPIDYPPTISPVSDVILAEDGVTTVNFTVGDEESGAEAVAVVASSSNAALFPPSGLVLGGGGAARTLQLRPSPNGNGTATITLSAVDPSGTVTNRTFLATVNAVNDTPTLEVPGTLSMDEDASGIAVALGIDDVETPSAALTVSAVSQNQAVIPNSGLVLSGAGPVRNLAVTPAANQSGVATIAVTVTDGQGVSVTSNLVVTVRAVNDAPTLAAISNLNLAEDAGLQTVNLSGISAGGGETQALVVTAVSSLPSLVPNPVVNYASPAATGSLQFTPVSNASGTAVITVTVSDGQSENGAFSRTFSVTIGSANDAPAIGAIAAQQTNEDTPITVAFTVGDAESGVDTLVLSATSTNSALVATTNIVFSGGGTNRSVTLTPSANASGTTLITLQASDGSLTGTSAFLLTVVAVNDPPTLAALPNFQTNSAGANPSYTINLTGIGTGAANESQTLTVSAVSSNPTFLPNPTVTYTSPQATGSIRLRPGNNGTGSATVSVIVSDGGAGVNSVTQQFLVTVKAAANVLPTIGGPGNQIINEDGTTGILPFTVRDAETAATLVTVTAKSGNPALVPDGNVVLGGSGTNRTVSVTPLPNQSGTAAITLTAVDDAFGATNFTFSVTVNPVNDGPTISTVPSQVLAEDGTSGPLPVTVGDADGNVGALVLTATSDNTALFPAGSIRVDGAGSGRSVRLTPAADQSGSASVRLVVSDGTAAATNVFAVTVNPVNDLPTISDVPDQTVAEDGSIGALAIAVGDAETAPAALQVSATSSNPALIPVSGLVVGGSGAARTLSVIPATNQFGAATITVTVSDGTNVVSDTFGVRVTAENDAPGLDPIADVTVAASASAPVQVALSGLSSGPANEGQSLVVTAVSSDPSVIPHPTVSYTSPAATGSLGVRPAAGATGSAVITVTANDGAAGGTVTRTFTVSINGAPTVAAVANQILAEDVSGSVVPFTIGDAETAAGSLTVTASSSVTSVLPAEGLVLGGTGASRHVTLTPRPDAFGSSVITLRVEDPQGNRSETSFLVTFRPVNDRPTLDPLANMAITTPSAPVVVSLAGITSGATNEFQQLLVRAVSSQPSILPDPVVNYSSPTTVGALTLTPTGTATGQVVITVTVEDDAFDDGSNSNRVTRTFVVDVTGTTTTAPELAIELVNGRVVVSWPATAGPAFVLQSGLQVGPGTAWENVATPPVVVNGRYTVTNEPTGQLRFYRLCDGCSGPPDLSVRLEGGDIVIEWPAAGSAGYVLVSSPEVAGAPWTPVAVTPVLSAGVYSVREPAVGGPKFYRLCATCGN